jgi:hypothetical protein
MSNILSNLSKSVIKYARRFNDPMLSERLAQQEKEEQGRKVLAGILSGQSIPQFARQGGSMPDTPQNIEQQQLAQLASLGSPEAVAILAKKSPLLKEPVVHTPLSTIGKIYADQLANLVPENIAQKAINKELAPPSPLVNVNTGGEDAGQKELAKSRAERITSIRNLGDTATTVAFGADRLQQAVDRGNVGSLSDIKALAVELADSFGIPLNPELLTKAKDVRAVERVLATGALSTLESLKGSTSNKDLDFAQKISGRVNQGKASLQELANLMKASSQKAQQISDAVVEADLNGASLKQQDALIARLKRDISVESLFNNLDLSTKTDAELEQMLLVAE